MPGRGTHRIFDAERAVRSVRDVAIAVAGFHTVPEIVGATAHGLLQLSGDPSVTVGVSLADEDPLSIMALQGFDAETLEKWGTIPRDVPTPLTDVLRTGEVMYFSSRSSIIAEYPAIADEIERSVHHAWAALPLLSETGPSGSIGVAWPAEREFSQVERLYLVTLAKLGGEALRRASREIDRSELVVLLADASDNERVEIARDLHDQSVQRLAAASIRLGSIRMDHHDRLDPELVEALAAVELDVQDSIRTLRNIIVNLHPPSIEHLDLGEAIVDFAEWLFETGADVEVDDDLHLPMTEPMADTAYRIATEALNNVARHAEASSVHVRITAVDDRHFSLEVSDDGVGFEGDGGFSGTGHLGMRMIRERVAKAGGHHEFRGDGGASLVVTLPLTAPRRPTEADATS